MSDQDPTEEVVEEEPQVEHSIMDRLRTRRAEATEEQTIELAIPGYEGELVAIYRIMDSRELNAIGRRITKQFPRDRAQQALFGSVDTLIAACVEIGVRDNGTYQPLKEIAGTDFPVKYDESLAEFLGFESGSAREVVFGVFGGREPAVIQHQMALASWMMGAEADVAQELLGER